jgi:hypothetical protein
MKFELEEREYNFLVFNKYYNSKYMEEILKMVIKR